MPLLTPEDWQRLQAEGKKSFLKRKCLFGVQIGLMTGALLSLTGGLNTRQRLVLVAATACIGVAVFFLLGQLEWKLSERKFSSK